MTAKEHNKLIGIFHLVDGGLQVFGGIIAALIYFFIFLVFQAKARGADDVMFATIFMIFALIITPIVLIFAAINLIAGWKMLKEKDGARTWGIVASIISLLNFPIGMALGVYSLWFLFGDEGKNFYLGNNSYARQSFPPPPPNNWQ